MLLMFISRYLGNAMNKNIKPVAVMCFSSGTGGMERSAVRLAETLSKVSEVTLFCKQDSFTEKLYNDGEYSFKCEPIKFTSRVLSFSMLFSVRSAIDKYGIGNVIFLGASELKTLYFSFLGKDLNVAVWHGTTKSRPKRDFIHNLVYSCVNHHVAISEHLGRNVKEIVPIKKTVNHKVIRPSFDFDSDQLVRKKDTDKKTINIVHVGRVAYGKGQIDAVLACRSLFEKGVKFQLDIIGGPDGSGYLKELEKTVRETPYKENVSIAGFVEDVGEFLREADIFLFPSFGEGMPNAFIEALHYDIVCIAYHNTVFPEFLDMGFYVHIVKNNDISALAEELNKVAADIKNECVKAKKNVELSKKYFSIEREIDEWLDILE